MATDKLTVRCRQCEASEVWDSEQTMQRLRALGLLRRVEQHDPDLVREVIHGAADRLRCEQCGDVGLQILPYAGRPDDDWGESRDCQRCGRPIPAERLEFLPDTTLCVSCQQAAEAPGGAGESEYCPRCGAVLQLKLSGQGVSRYVLWCRDCRWQG